MILSATNCIGSPLKKRGDVAFAARIRSDVLTNALRGIVPDLNYEPLESRGFACYPIRDCSADKPDVFLWSPYIDTNGIFWLIDGVPSCPCANKNTPRPSHAWLRENYRRANKLTWEHRIEMAVQLDAAICDLNSKVRKIVVLYDLSVLVQRVEAGSDELWQKKPLTYWLHENTLANSIIPSVLAPLGWEVAFEPYGLPKRGSWCHSEYPYLIKFYQSLGLLPKKE